MLTKPPPDDDLIDVTEDGLGAPNGQGPAGQASRGAPAWKVLIVDDDAGVHAATRISLDGVSILGAPLELLHAHSAREARAVLAAQPDIAVALLDVVMETDHAGLDLVREIRENGRSDLRIVLRTGQPGYAPELSVIRDYDINDYRTKAELTQSRLITTLTAAIRGYQQIRTITENRKGLELIIEGSADLFRRRELALFSQGVLMQIATLLQMRVDGFVCTRFEAEADGGGAFRVVSATGRFAKSISKGAGDLNEPGIIAHLQDAGRRNENHVIIDGSMILRFPGTNGASIFVYFECDRQLAANDLTLLQVFSTNIAIGFENLRLVSQLDELAFVDSELGVPNRNHIRSLIGSLDTRANHRMVLLGLEGIESIMSGFGQELAVRLLKAVYERLAASFDEGAAIARFDDDTFALVGELAALDPERVRAALDQNFLIDGKDLKLGPVIGIVDLSEVEGDSAAVMQAAMAALMEARRGEGPTVTFFHPALLSAAKDRVRMAHDLRGALESNQVSAYLQPKVHLASGQIDGVEALARWKHEGQFVPPAEFVPVAESSGLIPLLTRRIIEQLGQFKSAWSAGGQPSIKFAVNLSMGELHKPDFVEHFLDQIEAAGLRPSDIEVEITESMVMHDLPRMLDVLNALKLRGCSIALDDFGTGFSSLSYLEQLPLDRLKIDKCFVQSLTIDNARSSIPAVVISLAENLGLAVVAEGIETNGQHNLLRFLGCDTAQGYLYAKPMEAANYQSWSSSWDLDKTLQDKAAQKVA